MIKYRLKKTTDDTNTINIYEYDYRGNLSLIKNIYPDDSIYYIRYEYYDDNKLKKIINRASIWYHEYNEKGYLKCVTVKDSKHMEEFNSKNNIKSTILTTYYEYNEKGQCIHKYITLDNDVEEVWYEYDDRGNKIHVTIKNKIGMITEEYYEYDDNGNCIHKKSSDEEIWYKYDNGLLVYSIDYDKTETFFIYDEHGNLICERIKDKDGIIFEEYSEYEAY